MTEEHRPPQGSRQIPNEPDLQDAPPDRVPPHNAAAEAALLGACLLSSTALGIFATTVVPDDFYVPRHRLVAGALVVAFEQGLPTDPVSVAEILGTEGLERAGGPGALITLQSNTPATSSAARYASIVHDHATLRRLLASSERISALAWAEGDAHEAVIAAQEIVGGVASQNGDRAYSSLDVADTETLLAGDLEPEEATILTRTDGRALLYPGKMHMVQAEPSSGKTWLALDAVDEILKVGGSAVYLDAEDTARGILGRLLALGADPAAVRERFVYAQPHGAFGTAEKIILEGVLRKLNPDLVVIDGVAEFLTRDGLSEDSASDVVGWMDKLPRWISRTGAAVLMLDHVVKNREEQGRYARGSGAKLAVVDGAAYSVKVTTAFDRTKSGLLRIVIAKDKPGGVGSIGETAAMVAIEPHADGARVVVKVEADTGALHTTQTFRPTSLMARVSKEIIESPIPLTAKALRTLIPAQKPKFVSEAIIRLLAEGYLHETKQGSAAVLVSVKPYFGDGQDGPPIEDRTDLPAPELPLEAPEPIAAEPGRSDYSEEF